MNRLVQLRPVDKFDLANAISATVDGWVRFNFDVPRDMVDVNGDPLPSTVYRLHADSGYDLWSHGNVVPGPRPVRESVEVVIERHGRSYRRRHRIGGGVVAADLVERG